MLEHTLGIKEEDQTKSIKSIARQTQSSFNQTAMSFESAARNSLFSNMHSQNMTGNMFLAISDNQMGPNMTNYAHDIQKDYMA